MRLERQHWIGVGLLITLALAARVKIDDLVSKLTSETASPANVGSHREELVIHRPTEAGQSERDPLLEAATDPFKVINFAVPVQLPIAPTARAPIVEAKPVAPIFPYQFFGRMVAVDGTSLIFLSRDNALVPIKVGNVLDEVYRIDAMTDKQVTITYLPLNQQISIPMRSASE